MRPSSRRWCQHGGESQFSIPLLFSHRQNCYSKKLRWDRRVRVAKKALPPSGDTTTSDLVIRLDHTFRVALANVAQWWDVMMSSRLCHGGLGEELNVPVRDRRTGPRCYHNIPSRPATRNHTSYAVSLMGRKLATLHASMMYFSAYIC